MNKFLEFLEKHCQWVAIGLGGLFFVWILWGYLLTSPVALEAPGRDTLTPGTVDTEVAKSADLLRSRIDSQAVKMPPAVASQDPITQFVEAMAGANVPALVNGDRTFSSQGMGVQEGPRGPEIPEAMVRVTEFPVVPSAEVLPGIDGIKSARAQVVPVPVVAGQPAPGAAPGAAPGVVSVEARDISYIRGQYRIDPALIAAEFSKVNVPAGLPTMIVAVEVYRQEKLPDGTWTKEALVKLIGNNIIPWPLPPANANFQQVGQFQAWAESPQGQADLLRPQFYQVLMGEGPWDAPQNLDDIKQLVAQQNDADKAVRVEEARRKAEETKARRQNTPQGPPPGEMPPELRRGRRGGAGGGEFQIADPGRPNSLADLAGLQLAQARPPGYPPGYPGAPGRPPINPDDPRFMEEGMMPMPMPGQGAPGAPGAPTAGALPAAAFVPQGAPVIIGWFFDENVVEGHIYRYQVRYAIKNPMFQNNQVDPKKPELAQTFAIWSKLTDDAWSEERAIETSTRYYLANPGWQGGSVPNNVRVEVFKWAAGRWQRQIFQTSIGDTIGQKDAGIEFATASMLVDVRFDDRLDRAYVLVLGPDGQLTEREPIIDRNDPDRAALKLLADKAAPPAVGAAGGPGAPVAGR